ncbi:uncharacterized protein LOC122294972 [Carya illinoinensis]|uniref:uncharacterized protein LOC122293037 n=1 Tax=Carya illinoinensis TaxID=32201 RepID=UPI001C71C5CF|nr:uncharacterized protein LOC122293037 [Carya illinoinensis]XP_042959894.1 uncharacterized protein LOC122294972 [Carya illinoinensis]
MLSKEKVSSEDSSSSFETHTSNIMPTCICGSAAKLRTSNTLRNPGRSFFGCSKYNTKGLPHCNYFKWADRRHEIDKEIENIDFQMSRKEEELIETPAALRQIEEEVRSREEEFRQTKEEVQNAMKEVRIALEQVRSALEEVREIEAEIVKRESVVWRQCKLLRVYCIICIIFYLYFIRAQ